MQLGIVTDGFHCFPLLPMLRILQRLAADAEVSSAGLSRGPILPQICEPTSC